MHVSEAWQVLIQLTNQSIFRTPYKRAASRRRAPAAAPSRAPNAGEEALSGAAFTEDAIDWKVLAPLWSEEEKQVLVYGASFVFELFVLKKWCFDNITPCLEKLAGGRVVLRRGLCS